jgi:hypothetical protein
MTNAAGEIANELQSLSSDMVLNGSVEVSTSVDAQCRFPVCSPDHNREMGVFIQLLT